MSAEKPKVACFVCKWTDFEEELAGLKTRKAFSNTNVVEVPCLGRVDPVTVVETFQKGVDGVLLVGCSPPDCHFVEGNLYAEFTVNLLKKLFDLADLEPQRLELRMVSPLEETSLAQITANFVRKLKKPKAKRSTIDKSDANVLENLLAVRNAVADFRLRALIGKQKELTSGGNVYDERLSQEEFDAFADEVIRDEFIRHKMMIIISKKPSSVKELAEAIGMKPTAVFHHILNMRRQGIITLDRVEGTTPLYKTLEA